MWVTRSGLNLQRNIVSLKLIKYHVATWLRRKDRIVAGIAGKSILTTPINSMQRKKQQKPSINFIVLKNDKREEKRIAATKKKRKKLEDAIRLE